MRIDIFMSVDSTRELILAHVFKTVRANQMRINTVASKRLCEELANLKKRLKLDDRLEVRWIPQYIKRSSEGGELHGEVLGETAYLYDESEHDAVQTLKHEVLEHLIVEENEEDYVIMINQLIQAFNAVRRKKRERLVGKLMELV